MTQLLYQGIIISGLVTLGGFALSFPRALAVGAVAVLNVEMQSRFIPEDTGAEAVYYRNPGIWNRASARTLQYAAFLVEQRAFTVQLRYRFGKDAGKMQIDAALPFLD